MTIEASAPAKLVLLGEYAVLEGAPALVLATAQRARVRIAPAGSGDSHLRSLPLSTHELRFHWSGDGRIEWRDDPGPEGRRRLRWLAGLLEALAGLGWWPREPVALEVDTTAFHADDGSKLGLGSSAALAVALAGGGHHAAGMPPGNLTLDRLVDLHRGLQGGRGSGVDVAASLLGGLVRYRLVAGRPNATATTLPPGLALLALASGHSVSTAAALERLEAWTETHTERWSVLRQGLREAAERGCYTLEDDASAFAAALADYGRQLAALEEATGIEIFGAAHARNHRLTRKQNVAYKPSGAGGDFGIAASAVPQRIASLRDAAARNGIMSSDIDACAPGLRVGASADAGERA